MWHAIEIKGLPCHIVVKTKVGLGLTSTNPCPQGVPFGPLPPYNNFKKILHFFPLYW
jgi:hypothetical protein